MLALLLHKSSADALSATVPIQLAPADPHFWNMPSLCRSIGGARPDLLRAGSCNYKNTRTCTPAATARSRAPLPPSFRAGEAQKTASHSPRPLPSASAVPAAAGTPGRGRQLPPLSLPGWRALLNQCRITLPNYVPSCSHVAHLGTMQPHSALPQKRGLGKGVKGPPRRPRTRSRRARGGGEVSADERSSVPVAAASR